LAGRAFKKGQKNTGASLPELLLAQLPLAGVGGFVLVDEIIDIALVLPQHRQTPSLLSLDQVYSILRVMSIRPGFWAEIFKKNKDGGFYCGAFKLGKRRA
jgi:hypothetical protein